jgi:heptosyltransferase III
VSIKRDNILIYRLGSLGDTLLALPAFHAIRRTYPETDITLLTNVPVSGKAAASFSILGEGNFFGDVLSYPVGTRNPFQLFALMIEIRRRNIRTAINLSAYRSDFATMRDKIFFRAAGITEFIGFDIEIRDKNAEPDPVTGYQEWEASRIARRIQCLEHVDLSDSKNWDLKITSQEYEEADGLLSEIPFVSPIFSFSLGTKCQSNDWELTNWKSFINQVSEQLPGWTAVCIGSADEFQIASQCLKTWRGNSLNLCGKAQPRVTAAVLSRAKIFVGHDSGPLHLAATMGIACVGIYSSRNLPGRWYPRGDHVRILYHPTDCRGCGLVVCIAEAKRCILSISIKQVMYATMNLISEIIN